MGGGGDRERRLEWPCRVSELGIPNVMCHLLLLESRQSRIVERLATFVLVGRARDFRMDASVFAAGQHAHPVKRGIKKAKRNYVYTHRGKITVIISVFSPE